METDIQLCLNDASLEWHHEYRDLLMRDSWLRKKYNRTRRITDHIRYFMQNVPELWNGEPGLVIDIGCGPGESLEIARELGHEHLGYEPPNGIGGMGNGYCRIARLMHQRQNLNVRYSGFDGFIGDALEHHGKAVLVNMRGSIEQCLAKFLSGPPHHEHHDCHKQQWIFSTDLAEILKSFARAVSLSLRPNGHLLIHANGTGDKQGDGMFADSLNYYVENQGLNRTLNEGNLQKWSVSPT